MTAVFRLATLALLVWIAIELRETHDAADKARANASYAVDAANAAKGAAEEAKEAAEEAKTAAEEAAQR